AALREREERLARLEEELTAKQAAATDAATGTHALKNELTELVESRFSQLLSLLERQTQQANAPPQQGRKPSSAAKGPVSEPYYAEPPHYREYNEDAHSDTSRGHPNSPTPSQDADPHRGAASLKNFISKFDAYSTEATDLVPERIQLLQAAGKLEKFASAFSQTNQHVHAHKSNADRWCRWLDLRTALRKRFYPVDHLQRVKEKLMRFDFTRSHNIQSYTEAFINLLQQIQIAGPVDSNASMTAYTQGLPREYKSLSRTSQPNDLQDLQDALQQYTTIQRWPKISHANHTQKQQTNGKSPSVSSTFTKNAPPSDHNPQTHYKTCAGQLIPWTEVVCRGCKKTGHLASRCPDKPYENHRGLRRQNQPQAHNVAAEHEPGSPTRQNPPVVLHTRAAPTSRACVSNTHAHTTDDTPAPLILIDCGASDHSSPDIQKFTALDTGNTTTLFTAAVTDAGTKTGGPSMIVLEEHTADHTPQESSFTKAAALANNRCSPVSTSQHDASIWHRRFCHLGYKNLEKVHTLVTGIPRLVALDTLTHGCKNCLFAKVTRLPHPPSTTTYATAKLIHSDVIGPMPLGWNNENYCVSYIDHHSHYAKSFSLSSKETWHLLMAFKAYQALLEKTSAHKVKIHRTDRGSEYISDE
ncbi:MAG: hypothetical protein BJ554DRAFT_3798, partial [Olpidium bornovanus]